jgi:phosphate transport system protein
MQFSSSDPNDVAPASGSFEHRVAFLKRRLIRETAQAIGMLETALDSLWTLDVDTAIEVTRHDDTIDTEEVAIEQECFSLLALHHAFARDFRTLAFILKVNADIERVADHACSIAKIVRRMRPPVEWPTALRDLGERVPLMCHDLMRAVLDIDVEVARELVRSDKVIDNLDKRLFEEVQEMMSKLSFSEDARANALLIYRLGRELERVGDIMANIAEDVVYLATGEIVRHQKKRLRATPPDSPNPGLGAA